MNKKQHDQTEPISNWDLNDYMNIICPRCARSCQPPIVPVITVFRLFWIWIVLLQPPPLLRSLTFTRSKLFSLSDEFCGELFSTKNPNRLHIIVARKLAHLTQKTDYFVGKNSGQTNVLKVHADSSRCSSRMAVRWKSICFACELSAGFNRSGAYSWAV